MGGWIDDTPRIIEEGRYYLIGGRRKSDGVILWAIESNQLLSGYLFVKLADF